MPEQRRHLMENTILILLFLGGFLIFLGTMGVDVIKLVLNFIFRSILGIVIIGLANYFIDKAGGNIFVNINEISVLLSGTLGIWGVILLYIIRYYFTI